LTATVDQLHSTLQRLTTQGNHDFILFAHEPFELTFRNPLDSSAVTGQAAFYVQVFKSMIA
jgi:hypothetical protein